MTGVAIELPAALELSCRRIRAAYQVMPREDLEAFAARPPEEIMQSLSRIPMA